MTGATTSTAATTGAATTAPAMTIGGEAVAGAGTITVVNPATGEPIGEAPRCSEAQLDQAMVAAAAAWPAWSRDEDGRREALAAAATAVQKAAASLGATVTAEQGKPRGMAIGEAFAAAGALKHHAALELAPEVLRDDGKGRVEVIRRPLGVVAAITPWNFPVAIAAAKLAPALRAGNTVVLKPSPHTPLATLQLGAALRDVLPPGVVNIVSGGDELGAAMVAHRAPAKVTLTGSVATGREVAVSAGARLKRLTLELGGNDAAIVLDDADVAEVAERLFWESFANSGQACLLIKRLYAPAARVGEVAEALAAVAGAVTVGDGAGKGTQLGPVTTRPQLERVTGLVAEARAAGARAVCGGEPMDGPGTFYPPTILTGALDGAGVVAEEQFGPVLPVLGYDDVEEAVARANATEYGLGGSVWSADPERAAALAARLECGMVWVNGHADFGPDEPLAPAKCSGVGVENGLAGLRAYTQAQVRHRPATG